MRFELDQANEVSEEFGGTRTRAGACSEHAAVEKHKVRYLSPSAIYFFEGVFGVSTGAIASSLTADWSRVLGLVKCMPNIMAEPMTR